MFTIHFDKSFKKNYTFMHKHIMRHFEFISFKFESHIESFQ